MLADLLAKYGYLTLFVGCVLEGESVLLLAGLAAHAGYLSLPVVLLVAFAGGTLGDQAYFLVGRRYGEPLLGRWPRFETPAARVRRLIERHSALLIVGVRFMYGLRLIGPIVIGMSEVPTWRFSVFNMIGAAIWAVAVGGAGYVFGHAIEWLLADLELFEKVALVCATVVFITLLAWHGSRAARLRRRDESVEPPPRQGSPD
jgi:membrane protein DedA with SNARE-associated domain